MPSKSVTLDDEQYTYIIQTKDDEQSFSDRLRDVVDAGMEQEEDA